MRTYLTLVFAAAALFAVAKADAEKVKEAVEKCKSSENLDSLDGLKSNKAPSTEEEKCFIGCMMMDMKLLSSDGQYDAASTKEMINSCEYLKDKPDEKSAALEVADDCAGKATGCSGHCECGPKAVGCLINGMVDKGYEESFARIDKMLQNLE
uniref:Odorant-binding protein 5 n=1 Tax=Oedaleus asiaticus TaxID=244712 RepID=A0A0E3X974_9ORTH|nr:odorant-binding protein 5 [Oedaleus asiaticus]